MPLVTWPHGFPQPAAADVLSPLHPRQEIAGAAQARVEDAVTDLGPGRPRFPEPHVAGAGRGPGRMRLLRRSGHAVPGPPHAHAQWSLTKPATEPPLSPRPSKLRVYWPPSARLYLPPSAAEWEVQVPFPPRAYIL